MTFEEQSKFLKDTKKILDFFEDEELSKIFTENYLHKQKVKYAHDQLRKLIKDKFLLAEIDAMDKELGL